MTTYYDPADRTAAEWTAQAQESARRSQESWERSDTDGFLSQWGSDSMQRMYLSLARLAEQGNKAEFVVVADVDGNEVDARQVEGRYGWTWMVRKADGTVDWFNESNHKNPEVAQKRNLAKGYQMITVTKPALARFGSGMMPSPVWVPADEA